MKLNYQEMLDLRSLAQLANKINLAKKLDNMIEEEWNPGTTMPPMYQTIVIQKRTDNKEIKVRRLELLPAYSGRGEKSYSKVQFVIVDSSEVIELSAGSFEWRRV